MIAALTDSTIMVRRDLRRMVRYPSMTLQLVGMPVVILLLFVYVLGGVLGTGLGGAATGRAAYVDYVTPAIMLMAITAVVQGTAISVAMDMTGGIVDRFRTMAIARACVLTGHVVGSLVQAMLAVAVVVGVALLIGLRPAAGPGAWLALTGVLLAAAFAFIWLSVAFGLVSRTVESSSNIGMPLMLAPFFGSGFVPTDSMPVPLRWFAQYQPFTPLTETIRSLLTGTPPGGDLPIALGWCGVIALGGYLWSRTLYDRR